MKDWQIPAGARRWTNALAGGFELEGFNITGEGGAMGMAFNQWFSSSTVTPAKVRNVLLKLAGTDVDGNVLDPNDPDASYAYRYLRRASDPPRQPEFAPFIVNPGPGYAYQDYHPGFPFAAYDVESDPPRRLMVGHLENNIVGGRVDGKYWPPYSNEAVDNVATTREWYFIFDVPYSTTPDPSLQVDILNTTLPIMWWGTPNRRGGNIAFAAADEFLILANHVNSEADNFTFTSEAPTVSDDVAKSDVDKINVFPNPYLGFNRAETDRFNRFITFNHLPQQATIRIFSISGILLQTIMKDDDGQFTRWNLQNQEGLPAASGIYIAPLTCRSWARRRF
jgi:hypothetical protein